MRKGNLRGTGAQQDAKAMDVLYAKSWLFDRRKSDCPGSICLRAISPAKSPPGDRVIGLRPAHWHQMRAGTWRGYTSSR